MMTSGVHSLMAGGVYINILDTSLESFSWMEGMSKKDLDFAYAEVSEKLSTNPKLADWQTAFESAAVITYLPRNLDNRKPP